MGTGSRIVDQHLLHGDLDDDVVAITALTVRRGTIPTMPSRTSPEIEGVVADAPLPFTLHPEPVTGFDRD